MVRRFKALSKRINKLIITEDAFGLNESIPQTFNNKLTTNAPAQIWRFNTNAQKIANYRKWLKVQVDDLILTPEGGIGGRPWTAPYMESAYRKGATRAYTDLRRQDLALQPSEFIGGQREFLNQAFSSSVATQSIELLYTRSFTELQGITTAMDQQMSRILANGLVQGHGANKIAKALTDNVTKLTNTRAKALARTEIVRAHAEGQLDAFERLGVKEVGILAEWSTAGDDLVCPMCGPLEGVVMTIKEARGSLPRHPNCRCAWIPASTDRKEKGQIRTQSGRESALKQSVKAEGGKNTKKRTAAQIRGRSVWAGKNITPTKLPRVPGPSIVKAKPKPKISRTLASKEVQKVQVDEFGARLGTKKAEINKFFGTTPRSMKEIAARSGLTTKQISGHVNDLVKRGLIQKGPKGFFIGTTTTPKVAPITKVKVKSKAKKKAAPKATVKPETTQFATAEEYRLNLIKVVEEGDKAAKLDLAVVKLQKQLDVLDKKALDAGSKYSKLLDADVPDKKALEKLSDILDDMIDKDGILTNKLRKLKKAAKVSVSAQRKLLDEVENISGLIKSVQIEADFKKAASDILSWMPKGRITFAERIKLKNLKVINVKGGAGADCSANRFGEIKMASWGKAKTTKAFTHEFAHHMSFHIDDMMRNNNIFYAKRTVGEKFSRSLPGYRKVTGKRDKWKSYDTYAGRDYGSILGSDRTPEVISVGVETIWERPFIAAKRDPEWFNWIIGELKGIPTG
jgi:SPP1 gp7 family putative phage head morphogenesis protein